MTNEQMLAALGRLPDADLMTETKITDPLGAGVYYRADTVVKLLQKERERCADACTRLYFLPRTFNGYRGEPAAEDCADAIRALRA